MRCTGAHADSFDETRRPFGPVGDLIPRKLGVNFLSLTYMWRPAPNRHCQSRSCFAWIANATFMDPMA